ncbi:hypothetical protein ECANGB1_2265 [Enterospora canceri]|uniref:Uncharacterized protein n=1 Tax=Enterospora canceri TaxID=1081671 RepID=A0A1Y1S5J4_9MICR|nr:hypothetical protein ECANGB1_2265 [Enterospora canceri]
MIVHKIKCIIQSKLNQILAGAQPVVYNGTEYPFYFVDELFTTYSAMGERCFLQDFLEALEQCEDLLLLKSKNTRHSIVGEKKKVDKRQALQVLEAIENRDVGLERKIVKEIKQNVSIQEHKTNKIERQTKRLVFDYSDDDSLSSEFYEVKTGPKSLAERLSAAGSTSHQAKFAELRERMISAFGEHPVLPISSLNMALCKKHGIGFDWKTYPCEIYRHKHGTLKKFLFCCKFLKVVTFRTTYLILITPEMTQLCQKRILTYAVPPSHPKFRFYAELLLTSIFAIRVTVPYEDFYDIFKAVYFRELEGFLGMKLKKFIAMYKSPNIQLLQARDSQSVTVVPFGDESYTNYTNVNVYDEIVKMERNIEKVHVHKNETDVSVLDVLGMKKKPVGESNQGGWKDSLSDKMKQLVCIADMNIPKRIQVQSNLKVDKEREYDDLWKYLVVGVNTDNKRAYL